MNNRRMIIPIIIIPLLLLAAGGYYLYQQNQAAAVVVPLQASGSVEAVDINISPELGGRVTEVMVQKGDLVKAGDPLFKLDDQVLQSQRKQAAAALEAAKAGQDTAQAGLDLSNAQLKLAQANLTIAQTAVQGAEVQYQIALNNARLADQTARNDVWTADKPSEFNQPSWYFQKTVEITAAVNEVDSARQALDAEESDFLKVLNDSSNSDLIKAEDRLANARAAFLVAKDVLDRATAQQEQNVRDIAQSNYDNAKSELDAAQTDYDRLMSTKASDDVKEAHARVTVAQARYDTAQDRLNALLTGDNSLQVQAADIGRKQAAASLTAAQANVDQAQVGVQQAQAKLDQAKTAITQAQAALDTIDVQIAKLVIYAGSSGVVTTRNVEPGEFITPGGTAMILSQVDSLTITVYLPEDRYGEVHVGDHARVKVDSFPGKIYDATITRIADKAEFTPRNVQTDEGRRTTVFAVDLAVTNVDGDLKPGMPADLTFNQ